MRRLLVAAAVFGIAASANAADMPARSPVAKAPSAPIAVATWAGGYIGIQGGWGWGDTRHYNSGFNSGTFDIEGGLIGITSGYNWQHGTWVFGYESDTSYSWIDGTKSSSPCGTPCDTDLSWLSTYRLRVGPATPQHFAYITGGAAIGTVKGTVGGSERMIGWTGGFGVEGQVAPMWTGKIEYLFVDLGDETVYTFGGNKTKMSVDSHIVRVGLNYKFSIWDLFGKRPVR